MLDILSIIPGKKRHTTGGWYSFNAICCHHDGHKPDTKSRGGLLITGTNQWIAHCFNCNFKCGSSPGKHFSKNTKLFLEWAGVDTTQIERWSFANFSDRDIFDIDKVAKPIFINFDLKTLPEASEPLDASNPLHLIHIEYLASRSLSPDSYRYFVTPNASRSRDRNRIIIPYYYKNDLVGYTSRFYDGQTPKYVSEQQTGYVFNTDNQASRATSCILVEGQFDAISIGGCAYMSSTISDDQARLLSKLNKEIIVVPDRDRPGMTVCDRALELGYKVSIPEWDKSVKDTNDAVAKYGRLATLLSILEAATSSRITVEIKRKNFK